jgi:nicotinate-nucleotide adenylyltransferase
LRLGVLGGSFNPPHNGHLIIASDAFESLKLDRLLIIPANANPLKGHPAEGASPEQRLDMARLAFGGDARFEVSSMEIDRAGLSFTVDTLEALASGHPGAELVLLLGLDAARALNRWKEPERIRQLARLAVLARREDGAVPAGELPDGAEMVTTRRLDVSSTELRSRLAAGKPVKGFVAESVERYIAAAKLYAARAAV